jgi:hypothetical protein
MSNIRQSSTKTKSSTKTQTLGLFKARYKDKLYGLPKTKIARLFKAYRKDSDKTHTLDRIKIMKTKYEKEKATQRERQRIKHGHLKTKPLVETQTPPLKPSKTNTQPRPIPPHVEPQHDEEPQPSDRDEEPQPSDRDEENPKYPVHRTKREHDDDDGIPQTIQIREERPTTYQKHQDQTTYQKHQENQKHQDPTAYQKHQNQQENNKRYDQLREEQRVFYIDQRERREATNRRHADRISIMRLEALAERKKHKEALEQMRRNYETPSPPPEEEPIFPDPDITNYRQTIANIDNRQTLDAAPSRGAELIILTFPNIPSALDRVKQTRREKRQSLKTACIEKNTSIKHTLDAETVGFDREIRYLYGRKLRDLNPSFDLFLLFLTNQMNTYHGKPRVPIIAS